MAHVRKQIRDAAVSDLTGLEQTGENVFSGRARPLASRHPPTWLVYSIDESTIGDSSGSPPKQLRTLTLRAEGRVQLPGNADPEDLLDDMAVECERALLMSSRVFSLALAIDLMRTQIEVEAQGESVNGTILIDFQVQYRTAEGSPTVAV